MQTLAQIIEAVEKELSSARAKFPGNKMMLMALTEEHREVVKAMLDQYHAKDIHSNMKALDEEIRKELIQTISMCIRVLQEGDADFSYQP